MNDPSVTIDGEVWHKYFAYYKFEGHTFSFDFYARSDEEAEGRLRAIRQQATECHRIRGELSADSPAAGLRVRWACWWRNLIR